MKYPNIEAERARLGMNRTNLAKTLNVSRETYQNWQCGRTEIPCSKIIAMTEIFHVSSDYLLGINNAKPA